MQLSVIRTRLRARLGSPTTADVPDATLTQSINEAYQDILDRFRFHENRFPAVPTAFLSGFSTINISAQGISVLQQVGILNPTTNVRSKLTKRDRNWWDTHFISTTTGIPTDYLREGSNLYLWPVPDQTYTGYLWEIYGQADLAADGDIPALPTAWHHGIILLARYKFRESVEDYARAAAAFQVWSNWVATKTDELDEELKADFESGVVIPNLQQPTSRLDFDHSA